MKYLNGLDKAKFKIGDNVKILWNEKYYDGKSVRRKVIDDILKQWRSNTFINLRTFMDSRICEDSSKESLKELKAIVKGKKACELSIFKRHEDSKRWFKNQIEAINNFEGAVIIGVKANFHQGSKIAPFHISYMDKVSFFKYTVMVHGYCDVTDRKNHVAFEVELLSDSMKLISPNE